MKKMILCILWIVSVACASDNEEDLFEEAVCGEEEISLASDIQPIIDANCSISGCHNGSQFPNLSSAQAIMNNASLIKQVTQSGYMPLASSGKDLTSAEIQAIACWVDQGAPNN